MILLNHCIRRQEIKSAKSVGTTSREGGEGTSVYLSMRPSQRIFFILIQTDKRGLILT